MMSLKWDLIQYGAIYKRKKSGHRPIQNEDHVQGEHGHVQAKLRGLSRRN